MGCYKHQCPRLQNVMQNCESDYEWCSEIGMKGGYYEFKVLPQYFLGGSEENYDK